MIAKAIEKPKNTMNNNISKRNTKKMSMIIRNKKK